MDVLEKQNVADGDIDDWSLVTPTPEKPLPYQQQGNDLAPINQECQDFTWLQMASKWLTCRLSVRNPRIGEAYRLDDWTRSLEEARAVDPNLKCDIFSFV